MKKMGLPGQVEWETQRALALIDLVADGAQVTAPARERPLVHITVPLADLEAGKGGRIDGRPIADATVRRMLCDGSVVGVVLDEAGRPVSVGTKVRVPSPRIQRAVDVRDCRRCTYPGCGRPAEEAHHVVHWVDGRRTAAEILTSLCGFHHRAHHRGRFKIDINPDNGLVRFSRPTGGPILGRAATTGTADAVPVAFPVEPGVLPTRWDGSPLHVTQLTPPWNERAEPTDLSFVSAEPPEPTTARLAHTLGCRFEQEKDVWITSTPDLITITPDSGGTGSLISIELTTRPHRLTTTLTAIGLTALPADPPRSPGGDDG